MSDYKQFEERLRAIETKQTSIDDLVELLEDVRSALRIFVKCGNAFKWLLGLGLTMSAAYFAIKKALNL